jgi:hypothetical protein
MSHCYSALLNLRKNDAIFPTPAISTKIGGDNKRLFENHDLVIG